MEWSLCSVLIINLNERRHNDTNPQILLLSHFVTDSALSFFVLENVFHIFVLKVIKIKRSGNKNRGHLRLQNSNEIRHFISVHTRLCSLSTVICAPNIKTSWTKRVIKQQQSSKDYGYTCSMPHEMANLLRKVMFLDPWQNKQESQRQTQPQVSPVRSRSTINQRQAVDGWIEDFGVSTNQKKALKPFIPWPFLTDQHKERQRLSQFGFGQQIRSHLKWLQGLSESCGQESSNKSSSQKKKILFNVRRTLKLAQLNLFRLKTLEQQDALMTGDPQISQSRPYYFGQSAGTKQRRNVKGDQPKPSKPIIILAPYRLIVSNNSHKNIQNISFNITSQRISIVPGTLARIIHVCLEGLTHRLHRKGVGKLQRYVQPEWILAWLYYRGKLVHLIARVIASHLSFGGL